MRYFVLYQNEEPKFKVIASEGGEQELINFGYTEVDEDTFASIIIPTEEPEAEPSVEDRVATLEAETEELNEALTMILEGVTE